MSEGAANSGVPVRNLFHMLCYAWGYWRKRDMIDVSAVEGDRMGPLVAHVLTHQIPFLLRRGLDRAYVDEVHVGSVPRGKLLVAPTLGRGLLARQQLVSERSEFTRDIPKNQVLASTLRLLLRDPAVAPAQRSALRAIATRLSGITPVELTPRLFRSVLLHRNNAHYGFLVLLCELYASQRFLADEDGPGEFNDPWPDRQQAMGHLFEKFVFNFLRVHLPSWSFSRPQPKWSSEPNAVGDELLPTMKTDILAAAPDGWRIVTDTKFYQQVLTTSFTSKKLRSDHLYQVLAYCRALSHPEEPLPGLLLYAESGAPLHLDYVLLGHKVAVRTLDLSLRWDAVEDALRDIFLELAKSPVGVPSA